MLDVALDLDQRYERSMRNAEVSGHNIHVSIYNNDRQQH